MQPSLAVSLPQAEGAVWVGRQEAVGAHCMLPDRWPCPLCSAFEHFGSLSLSTAVVTVLPG